VEGFKSHRDHLFLPNTSRFKGRIVKLMGDGVLMEFASVVDAVGFAAAVQRSLATSSADLPPGERMDLRMAINIGDVVIEADDIFGNGVNVAARLEGLAEPGGVCVSGTVHEHVRGKVDFAFEAMGDMTVKSIPETVSVFRHQIGIADLSEVSELFVIASNSSFP
jgi:adenylate cyclase